MSRSRVPRGRTSSPSWISGGPSYGPKGWHSTGPGERANLPRDLMDLQEQHGERHRRKDSVIEDAVAEIVGVGPFTIRELFGMACPTSSISDRRAESRLADALRIAGWTKRHESEPTAGKRAYLWRLP